MKQSICLKNHKTVFLWYKESLDSASVPICKCKESSNKNLKAWKKKSRTDSHANLSEIAWRITKHIQRQIKNFWVLPGCWPINHSVADESRNAFCGMSAHIRSWHCSHCPEFVLQLNWLKVSRRTVVSPIYWPPWLATLTSSLPALCSKRSSSTRVQHKSKQGFDVSNMSLKAVEHRFWQQDRHLQ